MIRHTSVEVEKSVCYGQSNVPLSANFMNESDTILRQFDPNETIQIYSSPSSRCTSLANEFNKKVEPIIDSRIMELNFGEWELKKWDEIAPDDLNPWMEDFVNIKCPNGESYQELASRTIEFLQEIVKEQQHKKIIVISHGGVIRSLLAHILQIPLEKSFSLQIDYGKMSKIKVVTKENIIIQYINK